MVIAATPSSPNKFIMVLLNRKVVTPADNWLTISEEPLEQLFNKTGMSIFGLQKYNSLLQEADLAAGGIFCLSWQVRKNIVPAEAGIIYPIPVPRAAPFIPMLSKTIKT